MELIIVLMSYILGLNSLTYIIYAYDKKQAILGRYRVSEQFLLLLVVGGGMFGAILSMVVHRHKIKKMTFIIKYIIASIVFVYLLVVYNQKILIQINEFILFMK